MVQIRLPVRKQMTHLVRAADVGNGSELTLPVGDKKLNKVDDVIELSVNWSILSTARKVVMGPQTRGTTNHFVLVCISRMSHSNKRADSFKWRGW